MWEMTERDTGRSSNHDECKDKESLDGVDAGKQENH